MIRDKDLEIKIYELLGIKKFRKMAFILRDTLMYLPTIKMSKERRKNILYNSYSNYNIGKNKDYESIKKYKKMLFINSGIHTFYLLKYISAMVAGTNVDEIVILWLLLNTYCIMLQRYNHIRINSLLKKMEPRYEKQKEELKKVLKEYETLIKNHGYIIEERNGLEKTISFDELISNANIKELKELYNYLQIVNLFINNKDKSNNDQFNKKLLLKGNKTLNINL